MTKKQFYRRCVIGTYVSLFTMLICVFWIVFADYKIFAIITLILAFILLCVNVVLGVGEYKPAIPTMPAPMFTKDMIACVSSYDAHKGYWIMMYYPSLIDAKNYGDKLKQFDNHTHIIMSMKHEIYDIDGKLMYCDVREYIIRKPHE